MTGLVNLAIHGVEYVTNYEKNAKKERFVVFVVGDEETEEKIKETLGERKKYETYLKKF